MVANLRSQDPEFQKKMVGTKKSKQSSSSLIEEFYQHYYANVAPEDLTNRGKAQKLAAAKVHLKIAQNYKPGIPVIHVYNPDKARDGWYAHCTVIDIVIDDMPFLVDSIRMEVNYQGYPVNLSVHPIYRVERGKSGKIKSVVPNYDQAGNGALEAFIHIEIDRQVDQESLTALEDGVGRVLSDVRNSVADWRSMRDRLTDTIDAFDSTNLPLPSDEVLEAKAFLQWLDNNHFTFLGCRNYEFVKEGSQEVLLVVPDSGLGILRDPKRRTLSTNYTFMPPEVKEHMKAPELLVISKATARSTIHRPGHLDYIGVKQFDENGVVTGERRFLGLYTSTAYRRSPRDIPYLRDKIARVFARSKLEPVSHSGKSLMHVLETYPRDELFQISEDELFDISKGIVHLGESQRVKMFVRNDRFQRYISSIVFVPRDKFDTELRIRISEIVREAFDAQDLVFNVKLTDEAMARIEFLAMTHPDKFPKFDIAEIESRIIEASQTWEDRFKRVLSDSYSEENANLIFKQYKNQFPIVYKADFDAQMAVVDIEQIEQLVDENSIKLKVCPPGKNQTGIFRLRVFTKGVAIAPSDALPILENLGVKVLDEVPYPLRRSELNRNIA